MKKAPFAAFFFFLPPSNFLSALTGIQHRCEMKWLAINMAEARQELQQTLFLEQLFHVKKCKKLNTLFPSPANCSVKDWPNLQCANDDILGIYTNT